MKTVDIVISLALGCAVIALAIAGSYYQGAESVRTELIKSGHAEYVAGENGEPVWRMKEVVR